MHNIPPDPRMGSGGFHVRPAGVLIRPAASGGYTLSGSGYTLVGGFWGGASVEYKIYLPLIVKAS